MIVAYFKGLSQDLSAGTEETHEKLSQDSISAAEIQTWDLLNMKYESQPLTIFLGVLDSLLFVGKGYLISVCVL